MNTFYYKATDRRGKAIEGNIEASDFRNAVAQVRSLNYFPINISEIKPEKTFSEKPYLLLKIFDQKETLKEIRYCLFNDETTHFVSSGKYLPKIDYDELFIESNQSSEFSGLLSEIGFDLVLTKNIFDFKNFDVDILDKIIVSSKNWYKDFFKVSALNAITLKKVSFEEKNKVFNSDKYSEVGNFLVKVFFNLTNGIFVPVTWDDNVIKMVKTSQLIYSMYMVGMVVGV